jgi:hypothetical protein
MNSDFHDASLLLLIILFCVPGTKQKLAVLLFQRSLWSPFSKVKLIMPWPFLVLIMHVHQKRFQCHKFFLRFLLANSWHALQLSASHFALKNSLNVYITTTEQPPKTNTNVGWTLSLSFCAAREYIYMNVWHFNITNIFLLQWYSGCALLPRNIIFLFVVLISVRDWVSPRA